MNIGKPVAVLVEVPAQVDLASGDYFLVAGHMPFEGESLN